MRKRNPLWLDLALAVGAGVAGVFVYQNYVAPALAATPPAPGAAPLPAVPAGTPPPPAAPPVVLSTAANPPATPVAVPGGISVPADGNSAHVPVGGTLIVTAPAEGGTLTSFAPVLAGAAGVPVTQPPSLPITNGTATLTNLPAGTSVWMATWTNTAGAQTQQQFTVIAP